MVHYTTVFFRVEFWHWHYRLDNHQTQSNFVIVTAISQLPNLLIGTPRICNVILLLIVWVRSFSKMLSSVKFAEDKVFVFVIFRKNANTVQF